MMIHRPVLLAPFLELGFPPEGTVFVDATFGAGGHSRALLERFPGIHTCIGIDRDGELQASVASAFQDPRLKLVVGRFSSLPSLLAGINVGGVDGILFDLGVCSHHFDDPARGFSFQSPGPLDMRLDRSQGLTAADLVNGESKEELSRIFWEYGEERFSRRIARAIVESREKTGIATTLDLVRVVETAIPKPLRESSRIHPATRVFQALRIAVNEELDELRRGLLEAFECLKPGGRISVISFHSLEDRIVKTFFATRKKGCTCPPGLPVCMCGQKPTLEVLTRKPIVADEVEIHENPRARSAKMRVAQKIGVPAQDESPRADGKQEVGFPKEEP